MELKLNKEEFDIAAQKKQGSDMLKAIRELATALSSQDKGGELIKMAENSNLAVAELLKRISELQFPEVNVETNQEEVIRAVQEMTKAVTELSEAQKNGTAKIEDLRKEYARKKKFSFTIDRDQYGAYSYMTGGSIFEVEYETKAIKVF